MVSEQAPKEVTDRQYRLLPSVLEHVASINPERVYAAVPKNPNLEDGLTEVTFGQVLKAIDAFANYLQDTLGHSSSFETLEYVGVDDLRYVVFFFACIKTGYKALFISPRLTANQNARLVELSECRHLFYADEVTAVAAAFQAAAADLQIHLMQSFDYWLAQESTPMPYKKTFEQARFDPVLVLHSSGSTGSPKTVTQTNQWILNNQKQYQGRQVVGMTPYNFEDGGAGFFLACAYPVYSSSAAILLRPTSRPPTPQLLFNMMRMCRVRTLAVPPSIIEGIVKIPQGVEQLASLDYIHYAGGPLEKSCGDRLSQTVRVCSSFGTTETGHILSFMPSTTDWQFFEFHPAHNVVLEDEGDGTYELVLYQDKSGACSRPIDGTILRTEPVWRSKDLFVRDPERPHLWLYSGRKDDIIVFSTGQKWNPVPSEALIHTGTKADGVLIAGEGHTEPALLIETADHEEDRHSLLDRVWPVVEDVNSKTQRYGRISRSRIAFVKPNTFLRTGKATVVRKSSLALLQSTLDALYNDGINDSVGTSNGSAEDSMPKIPLPADITEIVRVCVHQIKTISGVKDDDDLFIRGVDSLEAAEIARYLKRALRPFATTAALRVLDSIFIFQNPTISWLAAAAKASLTGSVDRREQTVTFESLLAKYKSRLETFPAKQVSGTGKFSRVGITGSTGSLGSQILRLLLEDDNVTDIVCLNRRNDNSTSSNKLIDGQTGRASSLTIDFTKPKLGLLDKEAQTLSELDVIIHCAWEVNFNRSLTTFETQINALIELTEISLSGSRSPRLVFISSISAVDDECPEVRRHNTVPETLVTEPGSSVRIGYAVSKNVSEHLLSHTSKVHGLPTTVVRVGQIAGSTKPSDPAWNRKEWLPSLIDTSVNLSYIPTDLPDIDWVPVDICAQTIVDLATHDSKSRGFKLYNVVNPNRSPWAPLASLIPKHLQRPCEAVSMPKWIDELKRHDDDSIKNLQEYPSLKLLPFFEKSAMKAEAGRRVITTAACEASDTLRDLKPIGEAEMSVWLTQWGYKTKG